MNIRELFAKAEKDGVLTGAEIQEINNALFEDGQLDPEEKTLLREMSRKLKSGELKENR